MNIYQRANRDWKRLTGDDTQAGTSIIVTNPDESISKTLIGMAATHHLGINGEGAAVNVKTAHVSIHEDQFIAGGFTIRNDKNEVTLKDYVVQYTDSANILRKYVITQWFPDETTGIIVCYLGNRA